MGLVSPVGGGLGEFSGGVGAGCFLGHGLRCRSCGTVDRDRWVAAVRRLVVDAVMGEDGGGVLFRSDLDLDGFLPYLRLIDVRCGGDACFPAVTMVVLRRRTVALWVERRSSVPAPVALGAGPTGSDPAIGWFWLGLGLL